MDQLSKREVSEEDGQKLAQEWNANFCEVSHSSTEVIEQVFNKLAIVLAMIHGSVRNHRSGSLSTWPPAKTEKSRLCVIKIPQY